MSTHLIDRPVVETPPLDAALREESDRIPWFVAFGVVAAWVFMMALIENAAPAFDPTAPINVANEVLALTFWMALLAGAFGLTSRQRWGLGVSVGAAALLGIGAVMCYADGHTGAWLAIQTGAAIGLGTTSYGLHKFSPNARV